MDQAIAALIGSLLGAGATLLGARTNSSLQARKHRRDDYLAFLDAIAAFDEAQNRFLRAFVNDRHPADRSLEETEVDRLVQGLDTANFSISAVLGRVYLAGPEPAADRARKMFFRTKTHAEWARSWRREYMLLAVPTDEISRWQTSLRHMFVERTEFTALVRRRS
ncbi:hypothetical protein OIE50_24145 [Streptomyces canus]|uniref:hypothetical protein n=1 Tax=Streptomyces canus TaxID=58343 RepID=UPI00324AB83A